MNNLNSDDDAYSKQKSAGVLLLDEQGYDKVPSVETKTTKRCTKKRVIKIILLSTLIPIAVLLAVIGGYLLYTRMTYNPPPSQYSNVSDVLSLLLSDQNSSQVANSSSSSQVTLMLNKMVSPPWTDCGSQLAIVNGFFVEECPTHSSDPTRCSLAIEKDGLMEVVFTLKPNVTVSAPTFQACGKAVYAGTPCRVQPFSRPDPCVNSSLVCPLQGSRPLVYQNYGGVHAKDLPIKIMFDTVADIYLRLRDPVSNKLVFCVRMPAIIDIAPFGE